MTRFDVVTLIAELPNAHGVLDDAGEDRRDVFCVSKSVGMNEVYQAQATKLAPELKLVLSHDFEYQGERECEFNGVRYSIIRTYVTETDGIELTLQRAVIPNV